MHVQPLRFYTMSKSILTYFKPVGNRNGEEQVKLPDPTGPLTEELPSSVISAANKDIESSKKESSTKTKGPYTLNLKQRLQSMP